MDLEGVLSSPAVPVGEVIVEIGRVVNWLEAIGVIILFFVISNIVGLIVNRKKRKMLYAMNEKVDRIEKKLNLLLKK
jgi:hypothetical protein